MNLSLRVIQDQSESISEQGKDKNVIFEEAGLTPLLSFEDCDWSKKKKKEHFK